MVITNHGMPITRRITSPIKSDRSSARICDLPKNIPSSLFRWHHLGSTCMRLHKSYSLKSLPLDCPLFPRCGSKCPRKQVPRKLRRRIVEIYFRQNKAHGELERCCRSWIRNSEMVFSQNKNPPEYQCTSLSRMVTRDQN